jgi:hypothetical protein
MISGHCECDRIEYEIDSEITDFSHCHCSQCRRLHGAAYGTFGGVARDKVHFVSGKSDLKMYASSDSNDRFFCSECGSNIMVQSKAEPDVTYVCMGTMDGNPPCPPGYHIYVGSKAEWHEIGDDLEQFDELPPE